MVRGFSFPSFSSSSDTRSSLDPPLQTLPCRCRQATNQSIPKATIFAREKGQFDRTCMSLEPIYSRLYRMRLARDVSSQMLLVKRKRERERKKVCKQSAKLLQALRKASKVSKVSEFDDTEHEITACNCNDDRSKSLIFLMFVAKGYRSNANDYDRRSTLTTKVTNEM